MRHVPSDGIIIFILQMHFHSLFDPFFLLIRLFLERREEELQQMLAQFSATNMMDEKTELVVQFLNRMWAGLEQEPMFAATNDEQRSEAR